MIQYAQQQGCNRCQAGKQMRIHTTTQETHQTYSVAQRLLHSPATIYENNAAAAAEQQLLLCTCTSDPASFTP
jgi:hypothetical protein